MGRAIIFLTVMSVALLIFHFAGLIQNTPISWLLTLLLSPQDIQNSTFYLNIAAAIAAASAAGVIIGSFAPSRPEMILTGTVAAMLFLITWDLIGLFNILRQSNLTMALLICSPLIIMYIFTIIEWWLRKD